MEERIERLLAQMTLEEKVSMLAGTDHWRTAPVERLGIPAIKGTDGTTGARVSRARGGGASPPVSLPAWRWPPPGIQTWCSGVGRSSQDIRLVGCFALQNDPLERYCE